MNKTLRWREIENFLGDVETVLTIGGGTGAFTIPLAKRGFNVTHVNISNEMLRIARKRQCNRISTPLNLSRATLSILELFPLEVMTWYSTWTVKSRSAGLPM
ncbi:methyltransferase domain-containing protein [Candidatus Bathyarchaeota archaeon]|nr:methyltransferase domain-containing protein [Candidatus Bathyarchaeota archaeon]